MDKREKVIEGLQKCASLHQCFVCESCVYPGVDCAIDDAIALLKAQEPRVLTLEELAAAQKTPVWRETKRAHKDLYNGWMLAYDIQRGQGITGTRQGMTEPNGRIGWYKLDDYGKTWRCWTSRPTDEQREAVKWDG